MESVQHNFDQNKERKEMIEFVTNQGKKVLLSYTEVAKEFVDSPLSEENRDTAVNLIIFMDYINRKKGLTFVKMTEEDWDRLWAESKKLMQSESRKVA